MSCINIITNWLYPPKCKINETAKHFLSKKKITNWDLWAEIKTETYCKNYKNGMIIIPAYDYILKKKDA